MLKNHGLVNFIDLHAGAQTQTMECLWKHIKLNYGIRSYSY